MTTVLELRGFDAAALAGERRLLADTVRQRAVLLERPLKTADCGSLLAIATERLRIALALGDGREAELALRDACTWACAAELGGRCASGEVVIDIEGEAAYRAM